jgi:isoquinoline 1-oxidoreductase beta subunit
VAQVVEAHVSRRNEVSIQRVVCAIDCGTVVNPSSLEAQVEGAIVWGLSAALTGEITVAAGRVLQRHFADAPVLRMREMPQIEVYVIPSREPPGGAGEPAVTPVAPALVDAVHAAVGLRARSLPLRPAALERLAAASPSRGAPS